MRQRSEKIIVSLGFQVVPGELEMRLFGIQPAVKDCEKNVNKPAPPQHFFVFSVQHLTIYKPANLPIVGRIDGCFLAKGFSSQDTY